MSHRLPRQFILRNREIGLGIPSAGSKTEIEFDIRGGRESITVFYYFTATVSRYILIIAPGRCTRSDAVLSGISSRRRCLSPLSSQKNVFGARPSFPQLRSIFGTDRTNFWGPARDSEPRIRVCPVAK